MIKSNGKSSLVRLIRPIAILFAAMIGIQGHSQEKLRVADALPVGHYISEYAAKFWMQEVTW